MQLTNLAALLFSAATITSAATLPSIITADTIVADIKAIDKGVHANEAATEAYEGGDIKTTVVEGVPEFATVAAIHLANRKGFVDANLAPKFNEADTHKIFTTVVETVGKSIPEDIHVLISKYHNFKESGLAPVVKSGLELLIYDHDTFSAAVESKAYKGNAALTAKGEKAVKDIHAAIQHGIDVYSA